MIHAAAAAGQTLMKENEELQEEIERLKTRQRSEPEGIDAHAGRPKSRKKENEASVEAFVLQDEVERLEKRLQEMTMASALEQQAAVENAVRQLKNQLLEKKDENERLVE